MYTPPPLELPEGCSEDDCTSIPLSSPSAMGTGWMVLIEEKLLAKKVWPLTAGHQISVQGQREGCVGCYGQSIAVYGRKGKAGRAKIRKGKELARILQ